MSPKALDPQHESLQPTRHRGIAFNPKSPTVFFAPLGGRIPSKTRHFRDASGSKRGRKGAAFFKPHLPCENRKYNQRSRLCRTSTEPPAGRLSFYEPSAPVPPAPTPLTGPPL